MIHILYLQRIAEQSSFTKSLAKLTGLTAELDLICLGLILFNPLSLLDNFHLLKTTPKGECLIKFFSKQALRNQQQSIFTKVHVVQ